jgi:glycosyltransferase involved in cell wall biosynthesis
MWVTLKRRVARFARRALRRHARRAPAADAQERVTILLLSAWGLGGTVRATLNIAGHLAARHEVEILSVFRRKDAPFFDFPPGVRVTVLDDRRPHPRGRLERLLRRRASVLFTTHDGRLRGATLWTDLQLVRALRGRAGTLIATRPGLNLVVAELRPPGLTLIGQEQMHLRAHAKPLRRAFKRSYPGLDRLVVLTERDRQRYDALLGGRVPLTVIPNTIRSGLGPPSPLSEPVILAAGRLVRQKGFDLLIRAFAQVHDRHPEWRLVICGDGGWRARLEQLIEQLELGGAVSLPGPVEPLAREMDGASVFALSSRSEGFPLVLLEAMSKGLAVAAFDCPTGPRELIDDRDNGLLVPARDVGGLAAALDELMRDSALRGRLGDGAARTAQAFSMEAVGPRWDALIEEAAASPVAPTAARRRLSVRPSE